MPRLVVYAGVHIKEAVVTRMAHESIVTDQVAYISLKEEENGIQMYICMKYSNTQFSEVLQQTLSGDTTSHKTKIDAQELKKYLQENVVKIAKLLEVTVVTDFEKDMLLTVEDDTACFVYFGAMTKSLVHVAFWLRIPIQEKIIDENAKPNIFFWVLHTSYAQELEALGDATGQGLDLNECKQCLELKDSIEYSQKV